ncbi:hypothetical protein HK096_005407 [Nowakowskiella sp. JEL0078]|nr:hypothetical protein HK096_005407 [Nowakowskiella sp. JEL0078]
MATRDEPAQAVCSNNQTFLTAESNGANLSRNTLDAIQSVYIPFTSGSPSRDASSNSLPVSNVIYPFSDADDSADEKSPSRPSSYSAPRASVVFNTSPRDDSDDEEIEYVSNIVNQSDAVAEIVLKAGFLKKRDTKRKIWRKRWWVLRTTRIAYYKSEKEYELLGVIDVKSITNVSEVDIRRSFAFGIITDTKQFFIQAETREEMEEWISSLKASIREAKVPLAPSAATTTPGALSPRRSIKRTSFSTTAATNLKSALKRLSSDVRAPDDVEERLVNDVASEVASLLTYTSTPSMIAARTSTNSQNAVSFANDLVVPRSYSPDSESRERLSEENLDEAFSDDEDDDDDEVEDLKSSVDNDRESTYYSTISQSFKKRWFVLRKGALTCYKDENEYVVSRLVPLRTVIEIVNLSSTKHPFCIKLVRQKRSLVISFDSAEEYQKWLDALSEIHQTVKDINN